MKMKHLSFCCAMSLLIAVKSFGATFTSGSTGTLGAFSPTVNTVVPLPPDGVLNYTTINIPSGVTVTFTPNTTNTPVYMLASGNVTIAGTISVAGAAPVTSSYLPGIGGPGGFNGGYANSVVLGTTAGNGMGPGGGTNTNVHANYATTGSTTLPAPYGNVNIVPFIGGSGGAGYGSFYGSGGGGAILIASSTQITFSGTISANGGSYYAGGGSGGAIKLMANTITGEGTLNAIGGSSAGNGRIRLEAYTINRLAGSNPIYTMGQPGSALSSTQPALTITSIGGVTTPTAPSGSYAVPDMVLAYDTPNPVAINLSAANVPVGTTITVKVVPQNGAVTSVSTTLSGSLTSSTGSVSLAVPTTMPSVVTAQATFTVTAMMYGGEEIGQVRVSSTAGGGSEVTYITKTGKEIKAS